MNAKKKRRKERGQRLDRLLDLRVLLDLGDDHAGQERANDRRQPDLARERRQSQAQQHSGQHPGLGERGRHERVRVAAQQATADDGDHADEHHGGEQQARRRR
jgi:hypothetical protein